MLTFITIHFTFIIDKFTTLSDLSHFGVYCVQLQNICFKHHWITVPPDTKLNYKSISSFFTAYSSL